MRSLQILVFSVTAVVLVALAGLLVATASFAGSSLPRFVSLRADEVNMRAGPGEQYPIEWVYQRSGLPLEVIAEFDHWRRVRDWQGEEGWVHSNMLSIRRTVIVTDGVHALHDRPDGTSRAVAKAEQGVIGKLLECPRTSKWCRVELGGIRGWMERLTIWGVYDQEVVD